MEPPICFLFEFIHDLIVTELKQHGEARVILSLAAHVLSFHAGYSGAIVIVFIDSST